MEHDYINKITHYIKSKYSIDAKHPFKTSPEHMTFADPVSDKWFALILKVSYENLGISHRADSSESDIFILDVKARPEFISMITQSEGFLPGYHMNKLHWLTILLDGTVDIDTIYTIIDGAYDLITNTPTKRIYEAVRTIPKGYVATYAQVAELAGDRKMARAVGNALHNNPDPDTIPCYRVVNSKGELSGEFAFGGAGAQARLLEADGIQVTNGRVDLSKYSINLSLPR